MCFLDACDDFGDFLVRSSCIRNPGCNCSRIESPYPGIFALFVLTLLVHTFTVFFSLLPGFSGPKMERPS
jgi:hypothetical protein